VLKPKPGVYRMLDARGDVLYVGKARAEEPGGQLHPGRRLPAGCSAWSARPAAWTIVTTNSEAEALLLEAQLIKRFRPPYNVLLRDDKSFPFILLRADHAFPRIMKHRGARRAKGNYYGPFASAGRSTPRSTRCRSCSCCGPAPTASSQRRDRPCLLYQIKRCSAPCVGRIDEAGLCRAGAAGEGFPRRQVGRGAGQDRAQMAEAAENLDFETRGDAARPAARATFIQGSQAINAEGLGDADVFALAAKGGQMACRPSSSAAGRTGATARSSRATPKMWTRRGADRFLPSSTRKCRRRADPGRPRTARGRAAGEAALVELAGARWRSRSPSAATGAS
jgi:excinuclease ABC subunit C